MIITKMSLPRRTFLRGFGAALALPMLDAMVPALSAMANTAAPPRRLGFVYIPNGVNVDRWMPAGEASGPLELSPTLLPIERFRNQVVVFKHLDSRNADAQGDGSGDHARSSGAWLTGVHPKKTEGGDARAGKTVDQFAADFLGQETQFASLQLGVDDIALMGGCEPGYACVYQNTLSWRTPTTPMPMQTNPRVVFERLVGGDARTREERLRIARAQASILDSIAEEARQLKRRLGGSDRVRLDDYLAGVRELETRIDKLERQSDLALTGELPVGIPDAFEDHVKLMFDLQVLAYRADLTRVIAFMMSRETTQRTYNNIGVSDPHHGLSHHAYDPVKLEKQAKIDTYHVSLLAYFLDKLQAVTEGDGTLLEHSLILYGGCMSDSQVHSHWNLPTLVAGGGGGKVRGGRFVVCAENTPLTNLQLRLLEKVGVNLDKFGDSTGPLAEL